MKKKLYTLTYGLSLVFCLGLVVLSGCSKDDDPEPEPAKPVLSFKTDLVTVNEADPEFEIEVVLDQPAPAELVVDLVFDGSVSNNDIGVDDDKIIIAKGATSGKLLVQAFSDNAFEDDEVLAIMIDKVSGGDIEISRNDQMAIVVEQENGLAVILAWPKPNEETGRFADMDIVVWGSADGENFEVPYGVSGFHDVFPVEFVFIPEAVNYTFGLAFPYVYGNNDPLEFTVEYVPYTNGTLSNTAMFQSEGSYTPANKNNWRPDPQNIPPDYESTVIVQTITVEDGDYSDPGDVITAPESGSRVRTPKVSSSASGPARLKKFDGKFEAVPFKGSRQQQFWERMNRR